MNSEIKDNIRSINKGKVPNNYKNTEAGIIPIDWEDSKLGNRMRVYRGASPRPKGDPRYYGGKIPRLMIEDVTRDGKYAYPCIDSLTEEGAKKSRLLPKGSVVLSCSGTRVGIPGILGVDACIHDGFFGFDELDRIDKEFLYYFFGLLNIRLQSSATRGGVFNNLTTQIMKELPVGFPEIEEQIKIATILSTWDKAIELKEKLIQQKREQKRGLMKKLLTGEVRLPGFEGEWKYIKAGAIFESVTDKSHKGNGVILSSTQDKGIIPRDEMEIDVKFDKGNLSSYKKVNAGEFVISLRSFQGGIEYSEYEGLLSPAYTVLRNKIDIGSSFYKHLFKSRDFITRLNGLIYGIRDGKQIGYKDFSTMTLPYPSIEEQKAIAKRLNVANKEIILLEKELSALKLQKKGLMQLLLTGIVRVGNN